jgi:hypothetical protein
MCLGEACILVMHVAKSLRDSESRCRCMIARVREREIFLVAVRLDHHQSQGKCAFKEKSFFA